VLVPVGDEEVAASLFRMVEQLEDSDDVQTVYANFDMPDELIARLEG
jgi:transcriptional/translational regulatory protein YebC/TACO1